MSRSSSLLYRVVDAFTDGSFSGNPAAVVLPDPDDPFDDWPLSRFHNIAAEINLSETAFPYPPGSDGVRRLRWFTPTTEVTLCGHATLAAAHVLLEEDDPPASPVHFASLSGALNVANEPDGRLRLDFPADPPRSGPAPEGLLEALGVEASAPYFSGARCALVRLESETRVQGLTPDFSALRRVKLPEGVMGVSVTAPSTRPGIDFTSRFFGPWVGVDEDPVTGMAHTVLGPYWGDELGKRRLEARQDSARGGAVGVRLSGDRVELVGSAVTVARGRLMLP